MRLRVERGGWAFEAKLMEVRMEVLKIEKQLFF